LKYKMGAKRPKRLAYYSCLLNFENTMKNKIAKKNLEFFCPMAGFHKINFSRLANYNLHTLGFRGRFAPIFFLN